MQAGLCSMAYPSSSSGSVLPLAWLEFGHIYFFLWSAQSFSVARNLLRTKCSLFLLSTDGVTEAGGGLMTCPTGAADVLIEIFMKDVCLENRTGC